MLNRKLRLWTISTYRISAESYYRTSLQYVISHEQRNYRETPFFLHVSYEYDGVFRDVTSDETEKRSPHAALNQDET